MIKVFGFNNSKIVFILLIEIIALYFRFIKRDIKTSSFNRLFSSFFS